jgi:hypothetical protein
VHTVIEAHGFVLKAHGFYKTIKDLRNNRKCKVSAVQKSRVTAKLQLRPLFTLTQYSMVIDQTRFLSFSGSHKFFYRRDKHVKNYKVDYQRLKI